MISKRLSYCTEIDGSDSFSSKPDRRRLSYLRMEKMSWMLTGAVSVEAVLLGTRTNVKMDGFVSFSNITHIVRTL